MSNERVEIEAHIVVETDGAYLLDDGSMEEWVPKSCCQDNGDGTVSIDEWMAKQKGFI